MSDSETGFEPAAIPTLDEPRPHTAKETARGTAVLGYSEPPQQVFVKPALDAVLRDEAEFANRDYAPYAHDLEIHPEMFRKYTHPTQLWDWRQMAALQLGDIAGKDLLDYGCGMGEESIYFAKLGARVTAIDISDVGIATLRKRAQRHRLDVRAFEMRCDPTSFASASFDRVHGMGILHHVGIETALAEVWRLLRPGGTGVFLEPIGDHGGIEAVKTFLMKHARFLGKFDHVTDHEHNLTWDEIADATHRFSRAAVFPYHLGYRLKRFIPNSLFDAVRRLDHGVLTIAPSLRRYAGAAVISVRK
jgi:2-polyprenyl-3-methyl-5-hydroxy-6-metoxy-1,4-benzoquinol methylase